ncbi:hypothetical protein RhiirA1_464161 [Rhizophagus irregularis]|uniref:Uncharacterized protein n=1 Tax=Rhizophagus irregularis TaxID=588596 RepID=A0A2N0RIK8_9GLOM|nr:hypothetical protein RhiirA1_464161 [Rhizophagus irregularis]
MFYIFPKEAKEFLLAGSVKDKDLVHQNLYPIEFLNTLTKAKEFLLAGSVKDKDLVHQNLYPIEFLNTLTSKTPFHKLIFKVIISIILLKNINPIEEPYNTRLIVKKFQQLKCRSDRIVK